MQVPASLNPHKPMHKACCAGPPGVGEGDHPVPSQKRQQDDTEDAHDVMCKSPVYHGGEINSCKAVGAVAATADMVERVLHRSLDRADQAYSLRSHQQRASLAGHTPTFHSHCSTKAGPKSSCQVRSLTGALLYKKALPCVTILTASTRDLMLALITSSRPSSSAMGTCRQTPILSSSIGTDQGL